MTSRPLVEWLDVEAREEAQWGGAGQPAALARPTVPREHDNVIGIVSASSLTTACRWLFARVRAQRPAPFTFLSGGAENYASCHLQLATVVLAGCSCRLLLPESPRSLSMWTGIVDPNSTF